MKIIFEENKKYILRFDRGEEVLTKLTNFCEEKDIKAGFFNGIGATQKVELAWYDIDAKKYKEKNVSEKLEILNLSGNIAKMEEKTIIHCHGIFGNADMQTCGGHVKSLIVAATCEIFLETFDKKVERKYSEEIGLNLLQ